MQSLRDIRQLLDEAGLRPNRRFGQCFLIDLNLMAKVLALADVPPGATVLEVGPGTGSLTEELLARAEKVVAVEIDRGMAALLARRFGLPWSAERTEATTTEPASGLRQTTPQTPAPGDRLAPTPQTPAPDHAAEASGNLVLLNRDVLSSKHQIDPEVLSAVGPSAHLVSNLPYNIATPLIAECLINSWRAAKGLGGCLFERLTFTVQREVADRLSAGPGGPDYGPISVIVALLGRLQAGSVLPASAFWPAPSVASRMMRVDFDPSAAARLVDVERLRTVLSIAFGQRRKQMGSAARSTEAAGLSAEAWRAALAKSAINPESRAQDLAPEQFLALTNELAARVPR